MTAEVAAGVGYGSQIKLDQLWSDPYPTYKLLRENEPICFMPAANRYLVTRHQDVIHVDRHPEIFSNVEPNSLVIRAMGNVLLRKDGADHARQRVPCEPALRPAVIRRLGLPAFTKITNDLLDQIAEKGSGDLVADFASDCAALGLRAILGLPNTTARDLLEPLSTVRGKKLMLVESCHAGMAMPVLDPFAAAEWRGRGLAREPLPGRSRSGKIVENFDAGDLHAAHADLLDDRVIDLRRTHGSSG